MLPKGAQEGKYTIHVIRIIRGKGGYGIGSTGVNVGSKIPKPEDQDPDDYEDFTYDNPDDSVRQFVCAVGRITSLEDSKRVCVTTFEQETYLYVVVGTGELLQRVRAIRLVNPAIT